MDAVEDLTSKHTRRLVTLFIAMLAAALLVGGFGGYVIRAASSSASPTVLSAPGTHGSILPIREHLDPTPPGPQIGHSLEHIDGA